MKLSREEVLHIAALAKLGMTEEDIVRSQEQLSNILENFEILNQVDTENVPPTAQPNALCNVMKDDCARPSLSPDEVLANAPRREGDFFRIRAVLEED
jgi:aspartyl-tRNA(Asn)/glutamyl-tRNA(Gln) amidotransferase subunit C